ncbi:hypothetical protein ACPA54_29010 [Uniformispora flossi]|uniref:hypothetical protein n=1 Tax=Uniformispora flossi TaxID=3390723 RepID=UPI003C2D39E2
MDLDRLLDDSGDEELTRLTASGWNPTERHQLVGVADFEMVNAGLRVHLDHEGFAQRVLFEFTRVSDGRGLRISVEYGEEVEALVALLADWPSRITVDNFREFVGEAARHFAVYAEPPGADEDDEWIPVRPDGA